MDIKEIWEQRHKASERRFNRTTEFARFCYYNYLKNIKGSLLDVGCGKGSDSVFFHFKGFNVTAIDFSSEAIRQFSSYQDYKEIFIKSLALDIREPLTMEDGSFDVVYARLGLHNLTADEIKNSMSELDRVLKSEGILCIQEKSVNDKRYGEGTEIEKDMFSDEEGYPRHYFSEDYLKELLDGFDIIYMDVKEIENGNAYIEAIAKKK